MKQAIYLAAVMFATTGCVVGESSQGSNDENIIGGDIDYGDPSVVAILARQPGAEGASLCTGTVITPTSILTAAHCVDPKVIGAGRVFEVYTGTRLGDSAPLQVASVVWDTAFDVNNLQAGHDIAIVKLAQPTTLAPIPYGTVQGGEVRLVGYGMSTHVVHPLVDSGTGTKRTVLTQVNSASATLIDIGETNRQTCHGDSGGPALQVINGQETIVGVTSYGSDLSATLVCVSGATDTRVDAYLPFINANK